MVLLWQNAHVLSEGLQTEDGKRLRVIYPGRRGGSAGPDFRDSVIATEEGELLTGDVELHVEASSWYGHRHHVDPNYNGVVLHVVLHSKGMRYSQQQSKAMVPVASLGPVADLLGQVVPPPASGTPSYPPLRDLLSWKRGSGGVEKGDLGELLDRRGDQRFIAMSRSFALQLGASEAEQVLYTALLEALGYGENRKPFRELAQKVPIGMLRALKEEPSSTRMLAIQALLVSGSGLLPGEVPGDLALSWKVLLGRLPATEKVAPHRWRLSGVRPANHPVRRVLGAAHLVDRYVKLGLVRGMEEGVRMGGAHHLVQGLTVKPFIGTATARVVAVNAVLPFLYAWAGVRRDSTLRRGCLELYRTFPSLEDNGITREMRRLMSPEIEAVQTRGARRHQGLIHLYKAMVGRINAQPV